jgi:hypothetical protein
MEQSYSELMQGNRSWVAQQLEKDPDLFKRMSTGQNPQILWIGCSDSRVPANVITNSDPGTFLIPLPARPLLSPDACLPTQAPSSCTGTSPTRWFIRT